MRTVGRFAHYADGTFYVTRSQRIERFVSEEEPEILLVTGLERPTDLEYLPAER